MKNCTDCEHAAWAKTKAGKLHPSGDGLCMYEVKPPKLPAAMYWTTTPCIAGGYINRREGLREHCVYYSRAVIAEAGEK